jgi:hypothetical protein
MEQNIGNVGQVTESYSKGVVSATGAVALPANPWGLTVGLQVNASLDAKILIAYLAAKVGGPVPATVAEFLESALAVS